MTLISQIHTGIRPAPRRVMLYGVHGIGKSTFGSMADDPVFLPTEEGLGEIDCASFPLLTRYDEVLTALGELYTEKHDYRTVVIDSLDWLEQLVWNEVCQKRNVETIEDIGYAKGYTFALTQWREVLAGLDALRNDRGMAVVLLAHCKIERFENPETETYDRYVPRLHKTASAIVQEWCDGGFFATYQVYTKQTDEGFNRTRTQGIGSGERIMRTTERPAHVAKNRLNLPDELPLDFNTYAQYLHAEPGSKAGAVADSPQTIDPSTQPQTQGAQTHG